MQLAPWTAEGALELASSALLVAAGDAPASVAEMLGMTHAGVANGAARSTTAGRSAKNARMEREEHHTGGARANFIA